MENTKQLMDEIAISRALTRISFEITEKTHDIDNVILVGIKTRGFPLAKRIADNIRKHSGYDIPVYSLDISFYRDDLSKIYDSPRVNDAIVEIPVDKKEIILVDDVLFTGRTIRAAIEAIFSAGRPGRIGLAVLIDRGHRELPIKPDYVGKNVPTSSDEQIKVKLEETDNINTVELKKKG